MHPFHQNPSSQLSHVCSSAARLPERLLLDAGLPDPPPAQLCKHKISLSSGLPRGTVPGHGIPEFLTKDRSWKRQATETQARSSEGVPLGLLGTGPYLSPLELKFMREKVVRGAESNTFI